MSILDQVNEHTLPQKYQNMNDTELANLVTLRKHQLGDRIYIPGHHYQKDEVIQFANDTGDSLQLARKAAQNTQAEFIVFCGVHFMAETADILTADHQTVILPDLRAGCSMADMANIHQLNQAWTVFSDVFGDAITPLTYINSTAAIKSFCGQRGGATLTSSNAKAMLQWALDQNEKVLFLPDQHLGRNTAVELGIQLDEMVVWDPIQHCFEGEVDAERTKVILWKGHCSVHEKFTTAQIHAMKQQDPHIQVIVHPECPYEVVRQADISGSTKTIIETIDQAPAGSSWAIGTEMNLVNRLMKRHPDKTIRSLNPYMCPCLTMNRIDLQHFAWALDSIAGGEPVNVIQVDQETAIYAKQALDRMLKR
ncbi:quinolinate synthase NadA [Tuberibacillus sp. Marseille-P3662]|uniref:quinolinate synthase NadA n=1 Tax=Tuberibacillus sp. Marseille-P3662 TaxID=1965358 RepID=UPI000A1C7E4E|nr:quinolinate synthase NadA [Tuberibacillus sp. Marseille-P3662]